MFASAPKHKGSIDFLLPTFTATKDACVAPPPCMVTTASYVCTSNQFRIAHVVASFGVWVSSVVFFTECDFYVFILCGQSLNKWQMFADVWDAASDEPDKPHRGSLDLNLDPYLSNTLLGAPC